MWGLLIDFWLRLLRERETVEEVVEAQSLGERWQTYCVLLDIDTTALGCVCGHERMGHYFGEPGCEQGVCWYCDCDDFTALGERCELVFDGLSGEVT